MIDNLYIHVPFCKGKCAYCGFFSKSADAHSLYSYLAAPAEELRSLRESALVEAGDIKPRTLYLGGGTPSLLGVDGIAGLVESLHRELSLEELAEFTVEVNPADVEAGFFRGLKRAGVSRISIGVQSFSDRVLRAVGRRHDGRRAIEALDSALSEGFDDVGIDLIAGLPQEEDDGETLAVLPSFLPSLAHVSVYALTLEEGTELFRQAKAGRVRLPDENACMDELEALGALLKSFGIERYEISNYARAGFECRHNLAVWRGADYLGLGPSAATRLGRKRWVNEASLAEVGAKQRRSVEELSRFRDELERFLFKLRLREGFSVAGDILAYDGLRGCLPRWEVLFKRFEELGLLWRTAEGYAPTLRGMDLCDSMLEELYSSS